ncbi:diguanylate cyclase domain-containing protein [Paenibacillus periandrae]|uniref:diguanylate cyclase domain-containing protein n=1 Tax=Paenibacillus periandrae TaxID=1761741 RepID=UPI001F09DAC7|nr:diguanylate cyclase [Paenibacillus periandrae]
MKSQDRMYANILLQVLSIGFLTLYLILTSQVYPTNTLWFIVAILLGVVGYFRRTDHTLMLTFFVIAVYGSSVVYQLYVRNHIATVSWNELIWLLCFPFFSLIGGINRRVGQSKNKGRSPLAINRKNSESYIDEPFVIEESLDFVNHDLFLKRFEEAIFLGVRNKRKLSLMIVEINQFHEFFKEYGYEQTQLFLNKVAELINDIMPEVEVKAYLEEGQFAMLLSGTERANSSIAELWLDDHFNSMLLTRPRGKGTVTAKLRHSKVDCPPHGMTCYEILEKAQQELKFSEA